MMDKKVSIIISNRNDVAMLAVTVRSCLEELKPLGVGAGEVVICDNSDEEVFDYIKSALPMGYVKEGTLKLVRQPFPCLFSAREAAVAAATAPYILCVDSHMIIGRDMILDLYNFMESRRDDETLGFAHAPVNWAHQHERASKHDRDMSLHELGDWGIAYPSVRTITWKGMPWICRRKWFLSKGGLGGYGALSEFKLSWGGGDMHIGVKPWLLGYCNWAVPTSPGIHIGPFPRIDLGKNKNVANVANHKSIARYRLWAKSGKGPHSIGFLVSCYVLGGEAMMQRNSAMISKRFGRFINVEKEWEKAKVWGTNEKKWLDERKVMDFQQLLATRPWENGFAHKSAA